MSLISSRRLPADLCPDFDHRLRQTFGILQRLHKRAAAGLHIQHDGIRAGSDLLAHDGACDERNRSRPSPSRHAARTASCPPASILPLWPINAPARCRLPAQKNASASAPCETLVSTPACRSCRRYGRVRGRTSSPPERRRPRPAEPIMRVVLSPTPPVLCLSTFMPRMPDSRPDRRIRPSPVVSSAVSSAVIPRKKPPSPRRTSDNPEYRLGNSHV